MFRSFALTMVIHNFPRVKQMGLPAWFHFIPMVAVGYGVHSLKSMMQGKEPFIPSNTMEWYQAAAIGLCNQV